MYTVYLPKWPPIHPSRWDHICSLGQGFFRYFRLIPFLFPLWNLHDYKGICGVSPDAGGHTGLRGIALLLRSLAEVREAAADHCLAFVEHQVKPIVGQLDEDEEGSDGGAVDAQSHGGRGQGLWRGEVGLHHIKISRVFWLHPNSVWFDASQRSS